MPKKKVDPKETPEAQHKRFKELAREVGADDDAGTFERAFGEAVPSVTPSTSAKLPHKKQ